MTNDLSIGPTETKYMKLNTKTQFFKITFDFCIHFQRENFFFPFVFLSPLSKGQDGILIFSCLLFVLFDFFFQITESWLKRQNLMVWFDLYLGATLWLVWDFFSKNHLVSKKKILLKYESWPSFALIFAKLCNQVRSLDHFVVQNFWDFFVWKYKEVVCFYVSNLLQ